MPQFSLLVFLYLSCLLRAHLVLLELLVLLDLSDLLVCLVLEEIVVPLVVLVLW